MGIIKAILIFNNTTGELTANHKLEKCGTLKAFVGN
jgi:hypothetical protein